MGRDVSSYVFKIATQEPDKLLTVLREGLGSGHRIAKQVEDQMPKPVVAEPEAFGSVVRATTKGLRCKWQRSPLNGTHYWQSEFGDVEVWSELTDVEVLRVGLGEPTRDYSATEDLDPDCDCEQVAYRKGVDAGWNAARGRIHVRLRELLEEAITSERKNAFEKAIQAVEDLAP